MTFRQRAMLIVIAAMGAAVILGWVVARATNHLFSTVLMVEGLFVVVVGLIVALVGTFRRTRRKSSR